MKRKITASVLIALILLSAVAVFAGCDFSDTTEPVPTSFVSMEINPSIQLVLDQNENVISYKCENEDALVMLYGENLVGLNVEEASKKIIDLAVKMQYITKDNSGINVDVSADNGKVSADIYQKIGIAISDADDKLSFEINYNKEGSFMLNYQLAKLKDAHPGDENYQNLTAGKLKLINSAMVCDWTLSTDEAVKMSNEELLGIVDSAYDNLESYSTQAFEQAKAVAEYAYRSAVVAAEEITYLAKYVEYKGLVEGGLATVQYGGLSTAAVALDGLAETLRYAQNAADKALDDQQVLEIAKQLGVDVEKLKDADGKVTVESISQYIDKLVKNSANETVEQIKAQLDGVAAKLEEYKAQIEDKPLESEIITQIQAVIAGLKQIEGVDITSDYTLEDLEQLAITLKQKAQTTKEKMDASLSNEQKEQIVLAQQKAVAQLDDAFAQCNKAIDDAAKQAQSELQSLKQQRLESLKDKA